MITKIKFNRYHVTNGKIKARVRYSLDGRLDGRKCVTLYAKDWGHALTCVLPDVTKNRTDSQTDYFVMDTARIFEGHPLYLQARRTAELMTNA